MIQTNISRHVGEVSKRIASLVVAILMVLTSFLSGQSLTTSGAVSEIVALRTPFEKNLATIRGAREQRVEAAGKTYLDGLDRLQKEITSRGDLDGALAVKAERERAAAGREPSAEERRAMPAALGAARAAYEKQRDPIVTAARKQEEDQTGAYLSALAVLERRLTTLNQLEKALAVKAERERLTKAVVPTAGSPPTTTAPAVPLIPPGAATTGVAGRLDPLLADKIKAVATAKSYVQTECAGEAGGAKDTPEDGGLLVGFEILEATDSGITDIRSLRPFYLTREKIVSGRDRGILAKVTEKVMARNGYAVGGLNVWHNNHRLGGMQIVFMKIDARTGRLDPAPANSYKSQWFGARPRGKDAKEITLAGDGRPVIGVYGKSGSDADSLGLLTMP